MDDPPKAHPCVQAGETPALPGVASADRVDLPGTTQNENCWTHTRSIDRWEMRVRMPVMPERLPPANRLPEARRR